MVTKIKNNAKLIVRAGQIFLLLTISLLYACEEKHFITDATYRKMVEEDFQKKQEIFGKTPGDLFAIFDSSMTVKEREALMFLYAYSPLIDISFSGGEFFLKNVRLSFRAQEEMPWGKAVPEEIFRHFVLPVRRGKGEPGLGSGRFLRGIEGAGGCLWVYGKGGLGSQPLVP